MPLAASFATRSVSSPRMAAAVALPSRMIAVTGSFCTARSCPATHPSGTGFPTMITEASQQIPLTGFRHHRRPRRSMPEMAHAGEVQAYASGFCCGNDLIVADRATGLDDCQDAGLGEHLQAVGEGEVSVAGRDRPVGTSAGSGHGEPCRVDPVDLTHADPY